MGQELTTPTPREGGVDSSRLLGKGKSVSFQSVSLVV